MRTFTTITGAFNFIKRNLNTGVELTLNDNIHFGVGDTIYAYSKDVELALGSGAVNGGVYTHLQTDDEVKRMISYIFQMNGYMIISQ